MLKRERDDESQSNSQEPPHKQLRNEADESSDYVVDFAEAVRVDVGAFDPTQMTDQERIAWEAEKFFLRHSYDDRRQCKYGAQCYRRNPAHFADFSHPNQVQRMMAYVRAQAEKIKTAIRRKANWHIKLNDVKIVLNYEQEVTQQGGTKEAFDFALRELLGEKATLGRQYVVPTAVMGISFADNLVPESTRQALERFLDALANGPVKDFHPNTDGKVQDLIHPSLYPYIEGVSYRPSKSAVPTTKKAINSDQADALTSSSSIFNLANWVWATAKSMMSAPRKDRYTTAVDRWGRPYEHSKFQWLPAEFFVSETEGVKIRSYINNLDPAKFDGLYPVIAKIFGIFVPHLEEVLGEKLREKPLQVIVKACNYLLKPGQVYEGTWHVEGMSHEHIVASAIYYYNTSAHLTGPGLSFRRERDEENDFPSIMDYTYDDPPPGGIQDWKMSIDLGTVPTTMHRTVFFTNQMQHKVEQISLDPSTPEPHGHRKILCFFLVDSAHRITSTKDVPEQQWSIRKRGLYPVMQQVARAVLGADMPLEVVDHILDFAETGFTYEDALQYRLDLMRERKYVTDADNEEMEREFSLCEH